MTLRQCLGLLGLILLLFLGLLLSGCGQKGPLYLPKEGTKAQKAG